MPTTTAQSPPRATSVAASVASLQGGGSSIDTKQWSFPRAWKALAQSNEPTQAALRVAAILTLVVLLLVTGGLGVGAGKNKGWNWAMIVMALVLMAVLAATFVMSGFPRSTPRRE